MGRRAIAWLAIGIGVALVVATPALFPHAGQAPCHVEAERVGSLPADATAIRYGDLSATASGALDAALASPDGDVTVHGDRCPDRFSYTDESGRYHVLRGDAVYRVETRGVGTGGFPTDLYASWAVALAGGAVALVGVRGLASDALLSPAVAAGAGVATLVALGTGDARTALAGVVGGFVVGTVTLGASLGDRSPWTVGPLLGATVFAWFLAVDDGIGPHAPDLYVAALVLIAVLLIAIGRDAAAAADARPFR